MSEIISIKKYYDELESYFAEHTKIVPPERDVRFIKLMNWLMPKKKILDIGCNTGAWGNAFKSYKKMDVIGIDFEKLLEANKKNYIFPTKIGFAEELPFENETFDYVWCGEILIHSPLPNIIIEEMSRVLKPEGKVIISYPLEKMKGWHYNFMKTKEEYGEIIQKQFKILDYFLFKEFGKAQGLILIGIKITEVKNMAEDETQAASEEKTEEKQEEDSETQTAESNSEE